MAKKKPKPRDDDDDDRDETEEFDSPRAAKPKNDAYTALLVMTLMGLLVGCVLLYLDHDELAGQTVPTLNVNGSPNGLEFR
ncbi:MAG: hypothetical protein ACRCZF_20265, partial [Gemmataceae bacterium]